MGEHKPSPKYYIINTQMFGKLKYPKITAFYQFMG